MWRSMSLMIGLVLPASILLGQENTQPDAKLVNRCESGCSGSSAVMEATINLLHYADNPPDRVAVRLCSKKAMPRALSIAATDPIYVARWLAAVHNYPSERIVFLRSEDCLGTKATVAPTELWAIPKGAELPASVESVNASQVQSESIGTDENTPVRGARNYRASVQELIKKLRARPDAVGVVLGYYYDRPSSVMKKRLVEVRQAFKQSGLPKNRYFVRLTPWNGEYGVDPPDPEPKFPSVSLIEVSNDKQE